VLLCGPDFDRVALKVLFLHANNTIWKIDKPSEEEEGGERRERREKREERERAERRLH